VPGGRGSRDIVTDGRLAIEPGSSYGAGVRFPRVTAAAASRFGAILLCGLDLWSLAFYDWAVPCVRACGVSLSLFVRGRALACVDCASGDCGETETVHAASGACARI